MVLMTATTLVSMRSYGEFEYWFAGITVAAIALFLVLGAAYVLGLWPHHGLDFSDLTNNGGFFPNGVGAVFSSIVVVIFSMVGAEIATAAAAESSDPERHHQGDPVGHPPRGDSLRRPGLPDHRHRPLEHQQGAILFSTVVGFLCVVAAYLFPDTVFLFLLNSSGAVILVVYPIITISQIVLRRRTAPEKLVVKMWLCRGLSILAGAVLGQLAVTPDTRSQRWWSVLSCTVVVLVYVITRKGGGSVSADEPVEEPAAL